MADHDDKVFMKRFSGIIAGLVIVTILIIIIATFRDKAPDPEDNPSRLAMTVERVQPVAGVRTELPAADTAPAASATATAEPVLVAAAETEASDGIDGEAVYVQVCQVCHMTGAAGAPIPGSDLWAERVAKGADELSASAINGIGMMPPKGGRMDMSDDEIRAAVEYMLAQ